MQTTDLPLCVNRLHSTCAGLTGWSQPCSTPLRIAFFTKINLSIGSCRTDNPFETNWCKKSLTMLNLVQMMALLLWFAASAEIEREAMMMRAIWIFILRWVAMSCDLWWDRWAIIFTSSIKILYVFNDTLSPSFMVSHFFSSSKCVRSHQGDSPLRAQECRSRHFFLDDFVTVANWACAQVVLISRCFSLTWPY